MKIDMGRKGPLGMDLTIKNGVCYIEGTNHWLEWVHHFLPGARRREIAWGVDVANVCHGVQQMIHTMAGHSIGGTVAIIAAQNMAGYYTGSLRVLTYGAKRPPRPFDGKGGKHYRIKGDIVPLLPPWRPRLNCAVLDYGKLSPREAHGPRSYHEQMRKDGAR